MNEQINVTCVSDVTRIGHVKVPANSIFHDVPKQTLHITISLCNRLFPAVQNTVWNTDPRLLSSRLSQVSLWRENVNVSFTPVLSFIMIKQFILRERGQRETRAVASFIACPVSFTRLWFSIMLLSAAVKRPARAETNLSYSAFWFHSFSLSSPLLAYSFFTCDCQPVKVILNQSNPL